MRSEDDVGSTEHDYISEIFILRYTLLLQVHMVMGRSSNDDGEGQTYQETQDFTKTEVRICKFRYIK